MPGCRLCEHAVGALAIADIDRATRQPHVLERFIREAKIAARLRHPNILPVHEVGETAGNPYLVMEFVEGRFGKRDRSYGTALRACLGMHPAVQSHLRLYRRGADIHRPAPLPRVQRQSLGGAPLLPGVRARYHWAGPR